MEKSKGNTGKTIGIILIIIPPASLIISLLSSAVISFYIGAFSMTENIAIVIIKTILSLLALLSVFSSLVLIPIGLVLIFITKTNS